ncbi:MULTISPECIES: MerR family transcriptional regulator [Glycomyces]|uniref:DNA-binding transcriptional MerR regulator n=2 Tax=Glycomyces TaxID=58113 RepID=A0A9X3PH10_9ACTN|nr:MerR family transcriptional regulator [Glycomyces lechevalierae]MDA1383780.1 MerR family transcriptional regulator [Glycomyces lechevalierae]MDR7341227.1 DNA-binding transcriptional MerR regulator [Glycomyces lechevalierae]
MRIGELSERTGISRRMLRYYEETGMLIPDRCANGYRNYGEGSVDKALQIRGLLETGMPTRVVKQVLPCLKQLGAIHDFDATPETLHLLERELDGMSERIAIMSRNRDAIARYLAAVHSAQAREPQGANA